MSRDAPAPALRLTLKQLKDEGVEELAGSLPSLAPAPVAIDVSCNSVGPRGAAALCAALPDVPSVMWHA